MLTGNKPFRNAGKIGSPLPLADGATSTTFNIYIADDSDDEADETISFVIARLAGNLANGTNTSFTLTIEINDSLSSALNEYLLNGKLVTMNPNHNGKVFFNQPVDVVIYDLQGKQVKAALKTTEPEIHDLVKGMYLVRIEGVITRKLVIE